VPEGRGRRSRAAATPKMAAARVRADRRTTKIRAKADELEEQGVVAVACQMVDNAGVVRLMSVPIRRFEDAARYGVGMSTVFAVFLVNDDIVTSPGLDSPSGDYRLMPDAEATVAVPAMPGWAFAPVDLLTQEHDVFPACPRSFLKRMVADLDADGIELRAGVEIEFFLGRRADLPPGLEPEADPAPAHRGPGYSPQVLTRYAGFSTDLVRTLEDIGIGVHKYHPEYAIGQFEVSLQPSDPIAAADTVLLVRQVIRAVAANHGLEPSFAPVVFPGAVGNGQHLHLSLLDRSGRNLFADGEGPEGMTGRGEAFAAGVLDELPALTAVMCPSVPSYYRLKPHLWSGAWACWGRENREAALRFVTGMVGQRQQAANMEVKPIDGAGNPYLVLGSLIAAGIDGLERDARLPEPTTEDPAALPASVKKRRRVRLLPSSLPESVAELERSKIVRRGMGDMLFDAFLATRRGEIEAFHGKDEDEVVRAHRWRY
jgi:glutamine synthetase